MYAEGIQSYKQAPQQTKHMYILLSVRVNHLLNTVEYIYLCELPDPASHFSGALQCPGERIGPCFHHYCVLMIQSALEWLSSSFFVRLSIVSVCHAERDRWSACTEEKSLSITFHGKNIV